MVDDNLNDWRQQVPEDLRLNPSVLKFKDVGSLAKSYVELESMLGKRVELPDLDKAKPEEVDALYERLGRPKKFEEYDFGKLPEGMAVDETFGNAVKSISHKMGLNKKQFEMLKNWGIEQSQGMLIEQTKEKETSQNVLRAEWGFRYNDNVEKAHKALAMLVNFNDKHPFLQQLERSGMGDNPEFLKLLLEINERFGEDKLINSNIQKEQLDKDNARKKVLEIRADKKHPYWNENDPRHMDAVKEYNDLYSIMYPET